MIRKSLLYHFASWAILYILWITVFQNRSLELTRTLTVEFCYLIFIAIDYYAIVYWLMPRILQKKKFFLFLTLDLALIIVSAMARARLALFMNEHVFLPGKILPSYFEVFKTSFLNIFIWVQVITLGKVLFDKIRIQRQLQIIENDKIRNELNFLKAQINPHFLFNSLNSVYGNIDKSNKTARSILLKLSALLRYQLYDCNAERVIMSKEIDYLENYVALQKYRQEENLIVHVEIDNEVKNMEIAPLLLGVFIENAFKHVSNAEGEPNKIFISLNRFHDSIRFRIWNTKEDRPNALLSSEAGIGIVNIKRQLELLYPDKYDLTFIQTGNIYDVNLKLQLA
jgi:two-component system, LytTR family, sensor kinase